MASKIPVVSSIWGSFDQMNDKEDILIANNEDQWNENISQLIEDKKLRKIIAENGNRKMRLFHSYETQYSILKDIFET